MRMRRPYNRPGPSYPKKTSASRYSSIGTRLRSRDRVGDRDVADLLGLPRDHPAPSPGGREIRGGDPESRRQHPVERDGRAPSLDVAEDRDAGLEPGPLLDLGREVVREATEPREPVLVEGRLRELERPFHRHGTFRHHHDRERAPAGMPMAEVVAHTVDVEGVLGDQDRIGASRHPRVHRDPAGVPAHHLDEHDPVVALGGRVQPVDRVGRDLDGRVEPHVTSVPARSLSIVFGTPTIRTPSSASRTAAPERPFAADHDETVELVLPDRPQDPRGAVLEPVRVGARGTEDRPPARQDAGGVGDPERLARVVEDAVPAVVEAHELHAVRADAATDHRPDHRVQAGAIASAGEDPEAHRATLPKRSSHTRR